VEHVMDAGAGWQGEPNGDVVDELGHPVRPAVTGFQLATAGLGQRGCSTLSKAKKSPVADMVCDRTVIAVIVFWMA
jgi:hypothetical protein